MIYGKYKKARNAAWQCLIDYNISELPIKPTLIARAAGIKIIKNSSVNELSLHESGASILIGSQWYIVYDDNNSVERCRFTVAHELGHIFLGHETVKDRYSRSTFDSTKSVIEQEADVFASRLLAPACVLWALDIHTAEDIAKLCNISYMAAQIRAERMKLLYKRNMFLSSPLERAVYKNFEGYIQRIKSQ